MTLQIRQFPCLADNYGYLVRDPATGAVAAVDTPDAGRIAQELDGAGWGLDFVLNTHWHPDHAGGNAALKARYRCRIIAPRAEAAKIGDVDIAVGDGDIVRVGAASAHVIEAPGHTNGHIVYHFADDGAAFVGDVIFAMGCGRLFEGTAEEMWRSLQRIAAMPPATRLYCAHEYTQANARFAESIFTDEAMQARVRAVDAARAKGDPTVPTSVGDELATNPFLRARLPETAALIGMAGRDEADVFAELRRRKDGFRG
jgi:hydroxyacylglutathione hydrolase